MFQPAQLTHNGGHGSGNDRGFHRGQKQAEHDPSRDKNIRLRDIHIVPHKHELDCLS